MAPKKKNGDNVADATRRLHSFVQRIEKLRSEQRDLAEDIKAVKAEAKSAGLDLKVLASVVKRREVDRNLVDEFDALLETYEKALATVLE